ncbi:hypothetical protein TTHERM_00666130 (macronuclear) [Tetrahymena thermophila SB210]|uniref:Uncharacterized protein n=1 Tax=Tetrahymena thermophila (strain SB210) TaxID=312017 RepID=Q23TG9_TETTS|nr:hypothetical protein TTHERM_00666130 [Tetrahymena thermophila SB210]EAR99737.2 hypothetical protein TTHERM_00666130 [Tetrahymena thermophila SB210]|eukprot:XP_001019982.2 hypothetical protein TTHERM_00666130 [Tetrahymena thermophila SB210]
MKQDTQFQHQNTKRDLLINNVSGILFEKGSNSSCKLNERHGDIYINSHNQQKSYLKSQYESDSSVLNNSEFQDEEYYQNNDLLQKFEDISKNNICKNIIKAFFANLLDKNNDLLTDFVFKGTSENNARKQTKKFTQSYNFNNNNLHKLIQHPRYGKAFEFYLTFEAEYWLEKSKVKQKEDHQIYINFLKLCCCNTDYSNRLIAYKKGKKTLFNNRQ